MLPSAVSRIGDACPKGHCIQTLSTPRPSLLLLLFLFLLLLLLPRLHSYTLHTYHFTPLLLALLCSSPLIPSFHSCPLWTAISPLTMDSHSQSQSQLPLHLDSTTALTPTSAPVQPLRLARFRLGPLLCPWLLSTSAKNVRSIVRIN